MGIFHALKQTTDRRQLRDGKEFSFVYPHLRCGACNVGLGSEVLLSIGEPAYYQDCIHTSRWWESDLIATFGALKSHEQHRDDVMFIQCLHPNANEPIELSDCVAPPDSVSELICVCFHNSHFALAELNHETQEATVKDGLGYAVSTWTPHVNYLLRKRLWATDDQEVSVPPHERTVLDWRIAISTELKQHDGYNCGPIACMHLWRKLAPAQCPNFSAHDAPRFRQWVIEDLLRMIREFASEFVVRSSATVVEIAEDEPAFLGAEGPPLKFCMVCNESLKGSLAMHQQLLLLW